MRDARVWALRIVRSIAVGTIVLASCSPEMLGQGDDLRPRIATACRTEEGCRQLRAEAVGRSCQENTVGDLRCSDSQADLQQIDARIAEFDRKRAQAEMDRRRQQQEEFAAEQREKLHDRQVQDWQRNALSNCRYQLTDDACKTGAPDDDDDAKADCLKQCNAVIQEQTDAALANALSACVTRVVESRGSEPPDCVVGGMSYGARTVIPEDRRLACATQCHDDAAKILALTPAKPAPAPKASQVQSSAGSGGSSAAGGGGGMAACCDGTPSPTCACPGHRGCCSHHGGVCGCTQ